MPTGRVAGTSRTRASTFGCGEHAEPHFKPHAVCRARVSARFANPHLCTLRRSYFLRVTVNRNYSGKLVHEETFRVQAPSRRNFRRRRRLRSAPPPTHFWPSQVTNEVPENNPPIKMEVRVKGP